MSLLTIYNPITPQKGSNNIEFVLSYGNSISIGNGTKKFIEELLAEIGIYDKEVVKWLITPFRSNYYTDFENPR